MKIYTKVGDKGKTFLMDNTNVYKDSTRVSAYGAVDELNSFLGIVIARIGKPCEKYQKYLFDILITIQKDLFLIGSSLANPKSRVLDVNLNDKTIVFEGQIDYMTKMLPKLSNFILPGGGRLGAFLHIARAVCRRAERDIVRLSQKEKTDKTLLSYFNRLSDLLFTMARYANYNENQKEIIWKK